MGGGSSAALASAAFCRLSMQCLTSASAICCMRSGDTLPSLSERACVRCDEDGRRGCGFNARVCARRHRCNQPAGSPTRGAAGMTRTNVDTLAVATFVKRRETDVQRELQTDLGLANAGHPAEFCHLTNANTFA